MNEELTAQAEALLAKRMTELERSPYAYQGGAAMAVTAAAYALAVARGDVVDPPTMTHVRHTVEKRSIF